jgi:hypothetical protein
MNRRDFSLGGLKGLSVGALATMGCAGNPQTEFIRPGTKVMVSASSGKKHQGEIECVYITNRHEAQGVAYSCYMAPIEGWPDGYYAMAVREQIEVIS